MTHDDVGRRSRWLLRVVEWNDTGARYPNLWHAGMPRHVLVPGRMAGRLRLGDLIAVFHPASESHPKRAERYLGLSRVHGLREGEAEGLAWIDLRTELRFEPPLSLSRAPRRVLMCCDPGWPAPDVALFDEVFAAAVAAGWQSPDEAPAAPVSEPPSPQGVGEQNPSAAGSGEGSVAELGAPGASPQAPRREAARDVRGPVFAGVDFSGDMRDPRQATWLALGERNGDRLVIVRLEATGRHGLEASLRNPDRMLMRAEAIGLDFPFGLPLGFAETLLGGAFPEEGWWALARKLEHISRPDYLVALQEYRDAHGEPKRFTDERAMAFSPLHRVNPDLGPMSYHGIRMIAADRSRFAIRPFETAQGNRLLEVYPGALARRLAARPPQARAASRNEALLEALGSLAELPVEVAGPMREACRTRRDALDAVLAARLAAAAVLRGEADRNPDELAPEAGSRVRLEGWIYGLESDSATA